MTTTQILSNFTYRENALLERWRNLGSPARGIRLDQWTTFIQDSQIYLNEFRNFLDRYEESL